MISTILTPAIASGAPKNSVGESSCKNGECVHKLVEQLEDIGEIYSRECLPKDIKDRDIAIYHQKNGVSVSCFDMINKINRLEAELQKHKTFLVGQASCHNRDCKGNPSQLTSQVAELSHVNNQLMCTAERTLEIRKTCSEDVQCFAFSAGAPVSNLIFNSVRPRNCKSLVDNHCGTQIVTSFFKAAVTFFKGSWELLKMAGGAIGNKIEDLWEKVAGAEDHSSTSQLALAKASEDDGFFSQLTNDFSGTMKKIWDLFVRSTIDWLQKDVFCQSWSGVPHFSKCLRPSPNFDCTPCNTILTGLCTVSGTLVAEVIPAFLTGGLVTGIKHGAKGAISGIKAIKISDSGVEAIRASRVGKIALKATSKTAQVGGRASVSALGIINTYLLNPGRRALKSSYVAIENLMKTGSPTLAVSPIGKFLSFSGTTLSSTVRIVIYPIDNQLTQASYRLGGKSLDKLLTLGKPKLSISTPVTASIITRNPDIEATLARIEEAKISSKPDEAQILKLEKDLLLKVGPIRREAVASALSDPNVNLSEVIARLYPELQFGSLAKSIPKERVLAAENELYLELAKVDNTNHRANLLKKYELIVGDGVSRRMILSDVKPPFQVPRLERTAALDNFNIPLTPAQIQAKQAIREFMDKNFDEMLEKSRKVEEKIRTHATPVVYDTVAVGAGPKNAILVGALKETNPNLNVLVIESTDSLGTFHRVKGFDINSAEWIGDSGNSFPTSSLHLRDFNINHSAYATAEELGYATQATWQIADPDFLFKLNVTKVSKEPAPGAWPAKYKIETDKGTIVYARSTVVTPGLGTPINRLKDNSSIRTVSKYEKAAKAIDLAKDSAYIPKFQDVETFISNAAKDQKLGRHAVGRYRKKTTLLVGDGDGGSIGAEAALGFNKQLNPSSLPTNIQLVWMGQAAKSSQEFVNGLSQFRKARYGRIGEAIDDGRVKPIDGYLSKVEEFTNEAGEVQFRAYYTKKNGEKIADPVIVDNVVFATGYTHSHKSITPYFESMAKDGNLNGQELQFRPLHGKLNDFSRYEGLKTEGTAEINKQLMVNGQKEDIYLTGVGGKTPISKRKMKTVTGGFLDIAGARAAATGQHIAHALGTQNLTKASLIEHLTPTKGQTLQITKVLDSGIVVNTPKEVNKISNKLELGRSFRNFRTDPNSEFFLSIFKNEKGEMVFKVFGLDHKSGNKIVENLSSNRKLISGFSNELEINGNRIDIKIPARSTGTINKEGLEMRTVNIYVGDTYDATSRWPSAVLKVTSPSLKAAGQEKEEQ